MVPPPHRPTVPPSHVPLSHPHRPIVPPSPYPPIHRPPSRRLPCSSSWPTSRWRCRPLSWPASSTSVTCPSTCTRWSTAPTRPTPSGGPATTPSNSTTSSERPSSASPSTTTSATTSTTSTATSVWGWWGCGVTTRNTGEVGRRDVCACVAIRTDTVLPRY